MRHIFDQMEGLNTGAMKMNGILDHHTFTLSGGPR
jgi:hypothetical protein